MPDITKCKDESCEKKNSCWRYTSENSPVWQSFFTESPKEEYPTEQLYCRYYWPVDEPDI